MCGFGAIIGGIDSKIAKGETTDPSKIAQYKYRQANWYNKPGRENEAYTKGYNAYMGIKMGSAGNSSSPAPTVTAPNVNRKPRDEVITSRNRN